MHKKGEGKVGRLHDGSKPTRGIEKRILKHCARLFKKCVKKEMQKWAS